MDYPGRKRGYYYPEQRSTNRSPNKTPIRLASEYSSGLPQIDRRRNGLSPRRHNRTTVGVSAVDEAVLRKLKKEFELETQNNNNRNADYRTSRFGRRLMYPDGYYQPAYGDDNEIHRISHQGELKYNHQGEINNRSSVHNGKSSIIFHSEHDNKKTELATKSQTRSHNTKDASNKNKPEVHKNRKSTEETASKPSYVRVRNLIDNSQLTDNLNKAASEV